VAAMLGAASSVSGSADGSGSSWMTTGPPTSPWKTTNSLPIRSGGHRNAEERSPPLV